MGLFSRTLSRLDELKKVLTRDPASRQFLALADELRRQGQVDEAIRVLQRGLEQNASAVAGHVALGRLLQQAGRLDEALASYDAALRLDAQNLVALRQTAELHLSMGDKVGAIKKLKLFRGLSPGDREVNDLIRQLDVDLSAAVASRPAFQPDLEAFPVPPGETKAVAMTAPVPGAVVPRPSAVAVSLPALPEVPPLPASRKAEEAAPEWNADVGPSEDEGPFHAEAAPGLEVSPALERRSSEEPFPEPQSDAAARTPVGDEAAEPVRAPLGPGIATFDPERYASSDEAAAPPRAEEGPVAEGRGASAPAVTETLAELLRAQGHLGQARDVYRELAGSAPNATRARRFLGIAEEISATRAGTVRGRLEAWAEPFSRSRGPRDADLVSAVREVVERLGPCSAVVTDFEGVPVVDAGSRAEADAMESLSAELTAFWKNARRTREEVGEGTLDSLVLRGTDGTAVVKVITPAYALLLKVGPGIPVGRIRYEAVRAAEQLRPALL